MATLGASLGIKPGNVLRVFYFSAGVAMGSVTYAALRGEVWTGAVKVAREGHGTLLPPPPAASEPFFGPRTR
jgi:hypothetical protein